MKVHPSAVVDSRAEIDRDAEIGPYCVIEAETRIEAGCRLLAGASIRAGTTLGRETTICEGAVIGALPQHVNSPSNPGRVVLGARNVVREHVTVHRAMQEGQATRIGDDCLLMVGAHVAHDCHVGNRVILTNGAMLGGHVEVGDRACLGGNSAVHQFCRVGRLAMVGGCTKVVQDVPPFVLTDGTTALIVGLNNVGLRRAGLTRSEILDLKSAYRLIYREGLSFREMVEALEEKFTFGVASEFAEFFRGGQRGFVQERRSPPKVTLRVHPAVDELDELPPAQQRRRLAG